MKSSRVEVDCPACGRKAAFEPSNRWRPFCSQRCKTLDLGAWAAERYRISSETHSGLSPEVDPQDHGDSTDIGPMRD
ncbi:MAG: DNA gyrase inhibitor YacG [Burkholderiaceae bacterium]|nr:DNA gyrase inhibitor YacG [Burkholderiaceae bacterium]